MAQWTAVRIRTHLYVVLTLPSGPRTVCNACGLRGRQRKRRRSNKKKVVSEDEGNSSNTDSSSSVAATPQVNRMSIGFLLA